ncbi:MAG: uracil-DNA glycosylase [Sulfurimonas sp.]
MYHSSWTDILTEACKALSSDYQKFLETDKAYFPAKGHYFNAFKTLPRQKVRYILFGQDPYPRKESAVGYAFIDGKAKNIFSEKGLSKEVNRATSLRNFIKMLLVAEGKLDLADTGQAKIAELGKESYISTIDELRRNFERSGVLLLNTALVFTDKKASAGHIKAWRPFVQTLLKALEEDAPTLILFGMHAKALKRSFDLRKFTTLEMEHPYNTSFIANKNARELFGPMHLLVK